ncbi:(-)-5-epieremophilene synthase STPS3-like isoform X2 [Salvia splendens]|uniref:(-)-5-epieremophilene synthase STPS3-like isoform X2 n=1 Tax=Salvia splendens TaxID=180675 RepID=UPI001C263734|nr:(-)-5-epieremophilene synthase STPS3-like isoform X2 [Salvia splendens]
MAAVNSNSFYHRPEANFSPSLWGDRFINYISDSKVIDSYSKRVEVLKNDVRSLLTAPDTKMIDTMNLIDTLERLGVSYHFQNEIEEILQRYFHLNTNYHDDEAYDLYTVSLHFRLFRQHGHPISSEGKFQEGLKSDAKGLLSLYEASYLRTHGETILDDALAFTTANLKIMATNLGSPLKEQVGHALVQPLHFNIPRVEARRFISMYEEEEEQKNETLVKFAKIDFNLLQNMHKEELSETSRWWKELGLISKLSYARDRVVECYFWAMGVFHEPQFSRGRIMLAKTIAITSLIDDTYDAYGTIEELEIFTEAIQRWDDVEIARLPEYMRPLYKAVLEVYEQFEEELAGEGRSYTVYYAIEALKELVSGYLVEAKWFIKGYLPPFEEYLSNGLVTSTYHYLTATSYLGMGSARKEDFEWLSKEPKMLVAALKICRLVDDAASYEVEKERGQVATGIDSYMRENGVTKEEAKAKFWEMSLDAWKDSNEEYIKASCYIPKDILTIIFNLERVIDVVYKNSEDGYTHPQKVLEPHIIALLVDPIKV